MHDYPSYTHSYKKSLETIERNLKEHPSIKIVFDVHRDALGDAQNKVKFTADINGEKAAQAMLVCGTNSMGLWFDNWEDNLRFAMQIQDRLERCYPGLARPVNIRRERFNLHATRGSVLIEVGTKMCIRDSPSDVTECMTKTAYFYALRAFQNTTDETL